jgi:hypothetical protein
MKQVCTCSKHNPAGNPAGIAINAILKTDPTRTTTLRAKFVADVERRFRKLKADIRTSIIKNDCFGIQPEVIALSPVHPKAYEFKRTADKIEAFMLWLEEQEAAGILEIIRRPGGLRGMYEAWSDTYIHSAYAKGIRRGRSELMHAGYDVQGIDVVRGGVASLINQPFHADRLAVLYTRTFDDLKSVTQVMNASIRRQIADGLTTGLTRGMAEGKSPRVIARQLYKDVANHVDKIGRVRCRMIARTEIVRAHHLATIQEYRQADADMEVGVKAEFSTAGFGVCPLCIDLENGGPYSLDMIEGMIPVHPGCRCVALPVVIEKPYHVAAGPRTPRGRGIPLAPVSRVKPTVPFVPQAPIARTMPQPGAPYKTLKTIEECEAWATTNAGARNVYYQQIPELKVKGMGSKMTKAEALIHFNRVNKAINDYMQQQRIRMPEIDVFYITKTSRCRAARGWTREKGNIYGISFSPDWTDQNWADIAAWEKRTGKKWDWIREKDGYAKLCIQGNGFAIKNRS